MSINTFAANCSEAVPETDPEDFDQDEENLSPSPTTRRAKNKRSSKSTKRASRKSSRISPLTGRKPPRDENSDSDSDTTMGSSTRSSARHASKEQEKHDEALAKMKKALEDKDALLQEANEKLTTVNQELQAAQAPPPPLHPPNAPQIAPQAMHNRSVRKTLVQTSMVALIKLWIRQVVWRTIKFINNDQQQGQVTNDFIMAKGREELKGTTPEALASREEFQRIYGDEVTKAHNDCRSYAQSRGKDAAIDWMDEHNGSMPPLEIVEAVVGRTMLWTEADTDEQHLNAEVAVWYWDVFLPKITANNVHWNESKRHFLTLLSAMAPRSRYLY